MLYPKLRDKNETLFETHDEARLVSAGQMPLPLKSSGCVLIDLAGAGFDYEAAVMGSCKPPISWDPSLAHTKSGLAVLLNWQTGMSELILTYGLRALLVGKY